MMVVFLFTYEEEDCLKSNPQLFLQKIHFVLFTKKELLFSLKIASTEQQISGNDFVKEFQNTTKSIWTDELQQCWSDFCRSNYIILNSLNNYSITSMSWRPEEAQLKTFWG